MQEPGSAEDIKRCVSKFDGASDMDFFAKIKVNGDGAHPLFKFLKKALPGSFGNFVKWNFTKFLCDKDGQPVKRYGPNFDPDNMLDDILELLGESEGKNDSSE